MATIDDRVEVQTFKIRGSRVHAFGPFMDGGPDHWRIHFYPSLKDESHFIEAPTFDLAVTKAIQMAETFAEVDAEYARQRSHADDDWDGAK